MKPQLKKILLRLLATLLLIAGVLLVIILNPSLIYAHKTPQNNFSVFHDHPLDPAFAPKLEQAAALIQTSEFYNKNLQLGICLNDGSAYPELMRKVRGEAFAWGFYDKVVMQGEMDCKNNSVALNGYKWNLTQLLAHEMVHCLQFDKLGLWKSKPLADIPDWKWEGYAEYISRQDTSQKDPAKNIERLLDAEKINKDSWEISFTDGTIAPKDYYRYWLLVQYCMDIRKMSYMQVLTDTTQEASLRQEMMSWYAKRN
ncbi:MAG: hypothetical protein JWO09_205 [Bacteroidetes bacterium]|nr:hypothetical protein [Bacteroidota bacterium]